MYLCENPNCERVFRRQDSRVKHYRRHHPELGVPSPTLRVSHQLYLIDKIIKDKKPPGTDWEIANGSGEIGESCALRDDIGDHEYDQARDLSQDCNTNLAVEHDRHETHNENETTEILKIDNSHGGEHDQRIEEDHNEADYTRNNGVDQWNDDAKGASENYAEFEDDGIDRVPFTHDIDAIKVEDNENSGDHVKIPSDASIQDDEEIDMLSQSHHLAGLHDWLGDLAI